MLTPQGKEVDTLLDNLWLGFFDNSLLLTLLLQLDLTSNLLQGLSLRGSFLRRLTTHVLTLDLIVEDFGCLALYFQISLNIVNALNQLLTEAVLPIESVTTGTTRRVSDR